jgi:hypothetical protein
MMKVHLVSSLVPSYMDLMPNSHDSMKWLENYTTLWKCR